MLPGGLESERKGVGQEEIVVSAASQGIESLSMTSSDKSEKEGKAISYPLAETIRFFYLYLPQILA